MKAPKVEPMADAALKAQIDALTAAVAQLTATQEKFQSDAKKVDFAQLASVSIAIVVGIVAITGVNRNIDAVNQRVDSLSTEVHRMDDRLSADVRALSADIRTLTQKIDDLDRRDAVDPARRHR